MKLRTLNKLEHAVLMAVVEGVAEQFNAKGNEGFEKFHLPGHMNPHKVLEGLAKDMKTSMIFLMDYRSFKEEIDEVNQQLHKFADQYDADGGFAT